MSKPFLWSCMALCGLAVQACAEQVASIPPVDPVVAPMAQKEELYEELMDENARAPAPESGGEKKSGDKSEAKSESGDKRTGAAVPKTATPAKPAAGAPAAQPQAKPPTPKATTGAGGTPTKAP